MLICPHCQSAERQVKAGIYDGVQRYKCMLCKRRYITEPRDRGYPEEVREAAVRLHAQGMKIRQIGRQLSLNPRSIVNWVRQSSTGEVAPRIDNTAPPEHGTGPVEPAAGRRHRQHITVVDVAEHACVSVSTVSNFLNNKGRMSDATRARITEAMAHLNFTPNSLVRAIRRRRTNIIGVFTFGLDVLDQYVDRALTPSILSGIVRSANDRGYNVLLYTGWPHYRHEVAGLDFLDGHIDGLIWVSPILNTPTLDSVAKAGLPTVAVLTRIVPDGVGYVNSDSVGGIVTLVKHLWELGHKRIAYIGAINASDYLDRREGYREGLKAVGLPWDAALEVADARTSSNWTSADTSAYSGALKKWLNLPSRPTAIVAATDLWALFLIQTIREMGMRVPEDIAVTGFDDVPAAGTEFGGLTTVRQSFGEIGATSARCLVSLIDDAPIEQCRVTLPTELIVRASTIGASRNI